MTQMVPGKTAPITIAFVLLWGLVCSAQNAPPASVKEAEQPLPAVSRQNRRDPFNNPAPPKKSGTEIPAQLPPGKKGLVVDQLLLQGIARAVDGKWIAVVDNKSKRAYFLREKDELYNGVVSKITADTVVFVQSGTDPEGKPMTREIVKKLSGE